MDVCRECCVLSGRGLGDELITRPQEPYRLCCDREASTVRRPWTQGLLSHKIVKGKGKLHPIIGHEGPEGE